MKSGKSGLKFDDPRAGNPGEPNYFCFLSKSKCFNNGIIPQVNQFNLFCGDIILLN